MPRCSHPVTASHSRTCLALPGPGTGFHPHICWVIELILPGLGQFTSQLFVGACGVTGINGIGMGRLRGDPRATIQESGRKDGALGVRVPPEPSLTKSARPCFTGSPWVEPGPPSVF